MVYMISEDIIEKISKDYGLRSEYVYQIVKALIPAIYPAVKEIKTLRDEFAVAVTQGLLATHANPAAPSGIDSEDFARRVFFIAGELMKERNRT